MNWTVLSLQAGWIGFLFGVLSGALIGLKFHQADWLGGYGSFRRRMLRLGHIACFGMGLMNILFALSLGLLPLEGLYVQLASVSWLVALISMPLCCWFTVWKQSFRHAFPLPVAATMLALGSMLIGWGGVS